MCELKERIINQMADAERKAWDSLARYKFWMFGYHAAEWVKYNHLLDHGDRQPNPFKSVVTVAKEHTAQKGNELPKPEDLRGLVPDMTGGMLAEDYLREIRCR